jgi:hypothetical protein
MQSGRIVVERLSESAGRLAESVYERFGSASVEILAEHENICVPLDKTESRTLSSAERDVSEGGSILLRM